MRKKRKRKDLQIRKEEVKLSPFPDEVILYTEITKAPTTIQLELTRSSKVCMI